MVTFLSGLSGRHVPSPVGALTSTEPELVIIRHLIMMEMTVRATGQRTWDVEKFLVPYMETFPLGLNGQNVL